MKEENVIPQIKLEPHEVDQFLNLSPKGLFSVSFFLILLHSSIFWSNEDLCWSNHELTLNSLFINLNQIQ